MTEREKKQLAKIDLRDGFRIDVEPTTLYDIHTGKTAGTYAARLYERVEGFDRVRWRKVKVGPMINGDGPEAAARDLLRALNEGVLPGVEVSG